MNKKVNKMNGLNFISIGGSSEIGMNLYAYIYNDQWILVDMGMGFDNTLGRELVVPSPQLLIKNKDKIKALFITHSHEDHIGAIPYLWPMINCPVYARPFAADMIREKLSEFDLVSEVPLIKVTTNKEINIGNFTVNYISVAHSTPESCALAIKTPAGTTIHSGDWRLDDNPVLGEKTNIEVLKKYGDEGVLALMCDSTNVFKEHVYGSEKQVRENLINLVKQYPTKGIVITCFASNVARLETCYKAAIASNREMVIAGKSIKKIERVAKGAGYLSDIPAFIDESKVKKMDSTKTLIVCTGSQGEINSALSKIASDTHKNISLTENDIVIFSSRTIPGNEKSVLDIQNTLTHKGIKIISDNGSDIHASGHPSQEELKTLYDLVRPNIVIPIHGEVMQIYKQAELAKNHGISNVFIPIDGNIINISKDCVKIIDSFEVKKLCVDGFKLIPIDGEIYKQRQQLSLIGIVSACFKIAKGNKLKLKDLYTCGVFNENENEDFSDIKQDITSEAKLYEIHKNLDTTKELLEKLIKRIFFNARGKKPLVMVHIVEQ